MENKSPLDLEFEGVPLLEALMMIIDGCAGIKRLRDKHTPGEEADLFVFITDLLLWGMTPVSAFLETNPEALDPFIAMVESGEYLTRLKKLREKFVRVEEEDPGPTPESDRAMEIYQQRRFGSLN